MAGEAFAYLIWDNGEDRLTTGARIDRDNEIRGVVTIENRWDLGDGWSVFAEGTYISDENFIDSFFEPQAETRREFVSSLYARNIDDNAVFDVEARGSFNNFIANEYLLQSQGYQVQKFPEASYARIAEPLGIVSYTGEARVGLMNLRFSEPTLAEYGLDTDERADAAFPGLGPEDSLRDALRAAGYTGDTIARFDTRHEVEVPLAAGPVNIVPFAVGRFTAYDTDFREFRDAAGSDTDDEYRLWGAIGLRAATSLVRVDDTARSELWDVDRIRHVLEPNATIWQAGTTVEQDEYPIYDPEVESLIDGLLIRAGVRSTWQTMRGPDADKRSVDWITLDLNYTYSSADTQIDSPFGRFIEARPELSNAGEYFSADAAVRLTDAVTVVGDFVQNTEDNKTARASGGVQIDHGFGFATYAEARYLDGYDNARVNAGARYELTRKYAVALYGAYDFNRSVFQNVGATFTRRFPQWTLAMGLDLDNITDDVSFSVVLRPVGFGGEDRRRVFTYDDETFEPIATPAGLSADRFDAGPFVPR